MTNINRLAVAPMMDWTDRHCRYFHRLLAPSAALYSEMVTADAIIHGNSEKLLASSHKKGDRVILQLGGSCPDKLAESIRLAESYHYYGYNLNVGCPSNRVQAGRFGACLMAEPELVRDCIIAMAEQAKPKAVTVKCRLGIDDRDSEKDLLHFIRIVAQAPIKHFIIHARKAWLNGLSPKQNRTIPPLDYGRVERLADLCPDISFSINGGIETPQQAVDLAKRFRGVMVGRTAYERPFVLAQISAALDNSQTPCRYDITRQMIDYMAAQDSHPFAVSRHMLGLMHGLHGAKAWRRALSEGGRSTDKQHALETIHRATDIIEHINQVSKRQVA